MASNTKMRKKKCPSGKRWAKLPIPEGAPTGTKAKYGCKFIDGDKDPNKMKKGGASIKDPDIKAAKKEIRKGANVLGGGNAIDNFGHKHGYHSDKTKELDNSRLVQRKKRKYVKEANKSRIKDLKSKESKEGFKNEIQDGNRKRKERISELKADTKNMKKASKKGSKINRKIARLQKK